MSAAHEHLDGKLAPCLSKPQLTALLDSCERETAVPPHAERRKHVRGRRRMCDATLAIEHIGGGNSAIRCCTRNISAWGISLITNVFVHPNSPLKVTLVRNDGEEEVIEGRATHCRHLRAKIHEVGVNFAIKINPLFFLQEEDTDGIFTQDNQKPEGLNGWVLYISPSQSDISLFEHYVKGTDVKFKAFERAGLAIDEFKKGMYDVVLIDADAPDTNPADSAAAIREADFLGELFFLTADDRLAAAAGANSNVTDVLRKPFSPLSLQTMLASSFERTSGLTKSEEFKSSLSHDASLAPLLASYVKEVQDLAITLDKCIADDDIDTVRTSCLRIKGTGTSFGFEKLSELAQTALQQLDASCSVAESHSQLRHLAVMCRKAAA